VPPIGASVTHVVSAEEMYAATMARAPEATIAVATAAVSDWRPAHSFANKVKKEEGGDALALVRTPDILAALGARKNGTFLVGFAAETRDIEAYAREKLSAKHLDAIAVNDVSHEGSGFGTGANELVLLWPGGGREELGRAAKGVLARRMWDALLRIRAARGGTA
jgi:phosphopantothenoylcysteine decarboxylase/phosphopantothenate--cysteine ligase